MKEDKRNNQQDVSQSGKTETKHETPNSDEKRHGESEGQNMNHAEEELKEGNATDQASGSKNKSRQEAAGKKNRDRQSDAESGSQSDTERDRQSDTEKESESSPEQEYEETIAGLQEELESARNSLLRKAAEFDNLKKRTQRERSAIYEDAKVESVSRFLSVREDLIRSLEVSRSRKVDKGFLEGLEMILGNFDQILEQYGVEPIEETGIPFDVDKHDAMLTQPSEDDSVESNTVIQVLEPGYKLGDRVIRHAKVIVSQ